MKEAIVVTLPANDYLMIEGTGNLQTAQEYSAALAALQQVAATLQLVIRKEARCDPPALPLASLCWTDDTQAFGLNSMGSWHWVVMLMRPVYVSNALLKSVLEQVMEKKNMPVLAKACLRQLHKDV